MNPHTLTIGVIMGALLIAAGVIPGLFRRLAEVFLEGIQNFRHSLIPGLPPLPAPVVRVRQPYWLAAAGAALLALSAHSVK